MKSFCNISWLVKIPRMSNTTSAEHKLSERCFRCKPGYKSNALHCFHPIQPSFGTALVNIVRSTQKFKTAKFDLKSVHYCLNALSITTFFTLLHVDAWAFQNACHLLMPFFTFFMSLIQRRFALLITKIRICSIFQQNLYNLKTKVPGSTINQDNAENRKG